MTNQNIMIIASMTWPDAFALAAFFAFVAIIMALMLHFESKGRNDE